MIFQDKVGLRGFLKISLIYKDTGKEKIIFNEENVITNAAKAALIPMLYSAIQSDPITSLHVGTGGTIDPEGKYPKTADPTLTSLYNETLSYPISSHTLPDSQSVTFLVDVPTTDGNGSLISEAGMFTQSGIMFNIKTFPAVPKISDFSIHFEWTIKYV